MDLELLIPLAFGVVFGFAWCVVVYKATWQSYETQVTRPQKRCTICQEEDGDVLETKCYGRNYYYTHKYHMSCVMDVVCDPSEFDDWKVEQALAIVKARRVHKEKQKEYELKKIQKKLVQKSECRKACRALKNEHTFSS